MSRPYTKPFADYYDMRADELTKTAHEIEFFEFVFDRFARIPVSRILDVGCGTGRHSIPLMQEGYQVTGVDSSQNMLDMFSKKAEKANLETHILQMDMREIDFIKEFDAIICMNTVFLYLLTDEDISQTLGAFYTALKPGGAVIIDIMNFLSLLGRYKENVVEIYTKDGVDFERAIKHSIENVPAIWNHHEFGIIEDGSKTTTYRELHRFRMLNYNEMRNFLYEAGFSEVRCFGDSTSREEAEGSSKELIFVAVS